MAFSLFFVLLICLNPVMQAESKEILRADRSETIREPSGILRIEVGGVLYKHEEHRLSVSADSARVWVLADSISRARFFGRVTYQDSVRRLQAESMTYRPATETAIFHGRVRMADGHRRLFAGQVVYKKRQHQLVAEGKVSLINEHQKFWLYAQDLQYDVVADSGRALGNVRAIRLLAKEADTLYVQADTLRFSDGGEQMWLAGDVQMDKAGVHASAASGFYVHSEGQLALQKNAVALWVQKEGSRADSIELMGHEMQVKMEAGEISEIGLYEEASIRMEVLEGDRVQTRSVRADTAVLGLQAQKPTVVTASGSVTALMRAGDGAEVDLKGKQLEMGFDNGELDGLQMNGESSGIYTSPDRLTASRLSGGSLLLHFSSGAVQRVLVKEAARCDHRSEVDETGNIRLTGDRVELIFNGGKLQSAQALGGVKGSYAPVKSGGTP